MGFLSVKTVLISTGILSMAMGLKLTVPVVSNFILSEAAPTLSTFFLTCFTPPYLYLLLNFIILTIVATSKLHNHNNSPPDTVLLPTEPLIHAADVAAYGVHIPAPEPVKILENSQIDYNGEMETTPVKVSGGVEMEYNGVVSGGYVYPTNSCRYRRGMAVNEECVLCNSHPETAMHCLRDCYLARGIWQRAGFDVAGALFRENNLRQWMKGLLVDADPIAMATLWWIWRVRNSVCLEGIRIPDQRIEMNIAVMAADILRAFTSPHDAPRRLPRLVKWLPRIADGIIVNVDGSVCGSPSRGGFGGCYRNSLGEWKGGFYGFVNDAHILHLELLGIFYGLSFAWERGHRLVECQSDSLDAVNLVLSVPPSTHLYAPLVWDIKELLGRSWRVDFHHMLREGNACADFLAKMGAQQDEALMFVENPLAKMSWLLLADALGITSLRP